jgi:hypothetical protein
MPRKLLREGCSIIDLSLVWSLIALPFVFSRAVSQPRFFS